jgi:hypothetical protein
VSLDLYLECCECKHDSWARNATHNLSKMWIEAGVYDALYESHGKTASEIRGSVADGLSLMRKEPNRFKALNPPNGWGSYEGAIEFLESLLIGCDATPKAVIRVSR